MFFFNRAFFSRRIKILNKQSKSKNKAQQVLILPYND